MEKRGVARRVIAWLCAASVLTSAGLSAGPVTLTAWPQKFLTFYRADDPAVPAALRADPAPLPVGGVTAFARATDGAVWLGTAQGLMRIDDRAPELDRRQYFAGLRYLPDDEVAHIVPDAAAGVWVRTRTEIGRAHV